MRRRHSDCGDIYVSNSANNRAQMFRPDGAFVEHFRDDATLYTQC